MTLRLDLSPIEYLAMDALWLAELRQARRIWNEEHDAEKPAKKT